MSSPNLETRMCDECGRSPAKIWRSYKGREYCGTCYARVFKRRICQKCGNFARLNKYEPDAVCSKCHAAKPCARCGKTDYQIGKITPYGPVCGACASHFRDSEPCEVCGKPSRRLTRVSRLGHDHRVCPSCARADHGICEACHRYRLLESAQDGRKLCRACRETGEAPCTTCGHPMPAGRGKQCESCYWRGLLNKRVAMDCGAISAPIMAEHFRAFGEWLGHDVGWHKAAITLHHYLPLFLDIEKQWKSIPEYPVLLKHFGAQRLRRALLPMRWMQESGLVLPDAAAKEEDSDRRRIMATLHKFGNGTLERNILDGYHTAMIAGKGKETALRSIRLAMTPAAALLLKGREMKQIPPNQSVLNAYLKKTPGQRAAVSGFVRYLRDEYGVEICLPNAGVEAEKKRKKKLEEEMLALMQTDSEGDRFGRQWLSVALAYFHGLPKKTVTAEVYGNMKPALDGTGVVLTLNGKDYWLPGRTTYKSGVALQK